MHLLIEGRLREETDLWEGYSNNYIKAIIRSSLNLKNKLIYAKFKKIANDSMLAISVDSEF
jgi:hypothetical protein